MKKRCAIFAVLAFLALCITMIPTKAQAVWVGNLALELNSNGESYYVSDCNEYASGSLTIPATYNGKPVTRIGDEAFRYCTMLSSITIPDSVTIIGSGAFRFCTSLISITIPDSVTRISDAAFWYCQKLTSITIPDSVTSIGKSVFYSCYKLSTVTLPDGITAISDEMFYACYDLIDVTIPDSVISIGRAAFYWCGDLKKITIPDSVTRIGDYAFYGCSRLQYATIPAGITKIGDSTFKSCTSLMKITIPDSVGHISNSAFYDCISLVGVTYCGTEEQWNKIKIEDKNEKLLQVARKYHDWVGEGSLRTCVVCGSGHQHAWQDATCTAPKTCTVCGATEGAAAQHSYGDGVITKPATCKETGIKTYTCTGCSATKTEKINKLTTHTYDNDCDATCNVCAQSRTVSHDYQTAWSMDETNHWHECSVCREKTDVAAHVPGAEATETTAQTCTVCGYEIAPALGVPETQPPAPATDPATLPATQPESKPNQPVTESEPSVDYALWNVIMAIALLGIGCACGIIWKKKH